MSGPKFDDIELQARCGSEVAAPDGSLAHVRRKGGGDWGRGMGG